MPGKKVNELLAASETFPQVWIAQRSRVSDEAREAEGETHIYLHGQRNDMTGLQKVNRKSNYGKKLYINFKRFTHQSTCKH